MWPKSRVPGRLPRVNSSIWTRGGPGCPTASCSPGKEAAGRQVSAGLPWVCMGPASWATHSTMWNKK